MTITQDSWPAGATYVFFGTVAEDATVGTHVVTLTVTPGAGNELQLLYGQILNGNTATAQVASVFIDDGTNELVQIIPPTSIVSALQKVNFPSTSLINATNYSLAAPSSIPFIFSGTMRLILKVSTAAVSVTQTFAIVCRLKGAIPTATLNDTIGTSVNTTTTNKVF